MEDVKKFKLVAKPLQKEDTTIPELGKPHLLKPGIYGVKEPALIGKIYQVSCPKCHRAIFIQAKQEGATRVKCRECATAVIARGVTEEELKALSKPKAAKPKPVKPKPAKENSVAPQATSSSSDASNQQPAEPEHKATEKVRVHRGKQVNGKLVWGGIFSRKTYVLKEGVNYIGRADDDEPSDVSIKDSCASRRSVKIEVIPGNRGNSFKLTVENATNPVLVNRQVQNVGSSFFLNFGDTIVLGNTTLTFKEAKK